MVSTTVISHVYANGGCPEPIVVDITVRTFGHGTAATATFVNRNTRAPYTTPEFYSPDEDSDATGESAAWFVEQPPQLTLANFDQLIFSDCAAADKDEHRYGLTGGTEVNLVFRGTALAIGTIISDDQVGVNHIEQQEEQASEQAPEPEPEEPVIVCTEIDCSDIGGT